MIEEDGQPYLKLTDPLQARISRVQQERGRFTLEILKELIQQHMENPHKGDITNPLVELDPINAAKAWGVEALLVEDAFNALLDDGLLRPVGKSNHDLEVVELVGMEFDADVVHDEGPLSKPSPTSLYRHYSEDSELLYVGISKSAPARLAQHMAGSLWAREIARVEIVHLPSREEALAAEEEAIRSEKPLWNTVHNSLRQPKATRSRGKPLSKRKALTENDIMPSQAYLDHLDRGSFGGHEAALTVVRQWVRFCPYPEWVLLELPEGKWGALWSQGYGTEYTDMVLEGDYSLLSIVADTRAEVMRHMANNLMYPAESHVEMIALQRSSI